MEEYIKFDDAIKAMDDLEEEDIEAYGCKIPEGFDGERARLALCLLPKYKVGEDRPTGHWIKEGIVDANGNRNCRCSECGHGDIQAETQIVPYCWWCGAKMQKPQESEG